MKPDDGKNIIIYIGYILYSISIIGLIWVYFFIPYGNRIRLIFKGWLKVFYYMFFIFFYIGSLAVYIGGCYYFTVWYVLNKSSSRSWTPVNEEKEYNYNVNKLYRS